MSFFGKGKRCDLLVLARELEIDVQDTNITVLGLKKLITKSDSYDEEFVKTLFDSIISTRKEEEAAQAKRTEMELAAEAKRKEMELAAEAKKIEMQFEMEKLKLEIENKKSHSDEKDDRNISVNAFYELSKSMPKFDAKGCDIVHYLSLFEKQAKRFKIDEKNWVSSLLSLMPHDIVELIARISEEEFENYMYVKNILLKKFQLSAEGFRQKFIQHQRNPEKTWKEFVYEVTNYFNGWLDGLEITDFDGLKDLIITDQVKKRVPYEIRDHFTDIWTQIVKSSELAEKIDEYESVRKAYKKQTNPNVKHGNGEYHKSFKRGSPQEHKRMESKPSTVEGKVRAKFTCFCCGAAGHLSRNCPKNPRKTQSSVNNVVTEKEAKQEIVKKVVTAKVEVPVTTPITERIDDLKFVNVRCGERTLKAVIDTGAQISVLREDLIDASYGEGEGTIQICSAFGEKEVAALKIFNLKIDDGKHGNVPVTCAVSKKLVNDMLICSTAYEALIENVELSACIDQVLTELKDSDDEENYEEIENGNGNISDSVLLDIEVNKGEDGDDRQHFIKLQLEDADLKRAWSCAENEKNSYKVRNGILIHSECLCGEDVEQVVLPTCKRKEVLRMAHEIPLAGHLGEQKTKQRIKYSFFWPGLKDDVKKFCESCKICQLRRTVSYRDRIPIQPIVRPEVPFETWSLDCIGPLEPPSRRGHKYVICAVDLCTRWAEAIPVTNISAKTTCNNLMKIFTQTGFPKVICTDQGTNFTAKLSEAFLELLGVSPRFATPGHPESMGAVERWNRTLKNMINKNIQEHGSNWDVHLPYLLFAYREVPHSTTGISPYQLVYGRLPPGPLSLLKDVWTGERKIPTTASTSIENYICELVEKLRKAHEIATKNAGEAQERYASRYNLRARNKQFEVGDKVLVLIPSSTHKLLNTWTGPATVVEITRLHSALVEFENGSRRELHFNKLRPYIARVEHVGLIFDEDKDFGEIHYAPSENASLTTKEIAEHIDNLDLNYEKQMDLKNVICKYHDVFSTKPRIAKLEGHNVRVTSDCTPKRLHPYRIPIVMQKEVDRQIQELLALGLIEYSDSDWAHPIVCVAKKDGTVRLCVDFRLLNSFTIPDAYPMKIASDLIYLIGNAKFISVLDLTKGYWQIPMKEDCKHYTAFITHSGHYQWRVMPFGMKNAGSTFQKSIDKVLECHKDYCRSYIDDVAVFSSNWKEHIKHLQAILETFQKVGLTVNLKKCDFGKNEVKFLGHIIGSGKHTPDPEKTEAIRKISRPTTKKELRSVIGLANYYQEYIPNFASVILPLTELTKKRVPNEIPWSDVQETAFQNLKQQLVNMPSLYTPNIGKPFQLYTDASSKAVGACLSQFDDSGKEHPIAFFSKKLSPCETKWSTIEREAFSVLTALRKFDTWLFGAEVEVISDHNPLTYLTKTMPHGAKLARWALALQRYNLKITYRKGKNHGNADSLSRLP